MITVDMTGAIRVHHASTANSATVAFEDAKGCSMAMDFTGPRTTIAADLATVFMAHDDPELAGLLEAAMLALDTPSQAHLAALIKAAQDMQAELAEAAQ